MKIFRVTLALYSAGFVVVATYQLSICGAQSWWWALVLAANCWAFAANVIKVREN